MAGGRPTKYSEKLAGEICVRLAGGESLRSICSDDGMPDKGEFTIYALAEPGTETVRYVGQTKYPHRRLSQHINERPDGRYNRRLGWLKSVRDKGQKPEMIVLETTNDWDSAERFWVSTLSEAGFDLVNGNEGGKTLSHAHVAKSRSMYPGRYTPLQIARQSMRSIIREAEQQGRVSVAERMRSRLSEMNASVDRFCRKHGKRAGTDYINLQLSLKKPEVYGHAEI